MFTSSVHMYLVFFFKQKTAYEMRISDWSSDVCSSDLARQYESEGEGKPRSLGPLPQAPRQGRGICEPRDGNGPQQLFQRPGGPPRRRDPHGSALISSRRKEFPMARSEEHTSELQALMRISYAVFCLKKNIILLRHLTKHESRHSKA